MACFSLHYICFMQLAGNKKIYFLSDFHLGVPNAEESLIREKKIVTFLEEVRTDAALIFIVGDIFEFWYEYRTVVPKGYVRLLGALAQLTDAGIPVHFFVGNHDMWMRDYFQKELNIPVYYEPKEFEFNGKQFLIGHGDGLGPGDHGYKMLKKIFRSPVSRWLFGILPPVVGVGLANFFSRRRRVVTSAKEGAFLGAEKEWQIQYCKKILQTKKVDYLVFGHRHLPIDFCLTNESRYINLGDWIQYYTYAVFDGQQLTLQSRYPELDDKIVRK